MAKQVPTDVPYEEQENAVVESRATFPAIWRKQMTTMDIRMLPWSEYDIGADSPLRGVKRVES